MRQNQRSVSAAIHHPIFARLWGVMSRHEPVEIRRHRDELLAELRRVLRPGGELRFYEHIRSDRRAAALGQRAVDQIFWPRAFAGCHTHRDTPAAIAGAGFEIERDRRMSVGPLPIANPVAAHAIGRARRA
jgi:SAM-dependent methyltransferase